MRKKQVLALCVHDPGSETEICAEFSSNASRSIRTDIDVNTLTNLRTGLRTDSGVDVFGWVRNVFDTEHYEVLATTPGNTGLIAGNVGDPRTYGVTVGLSF